MSTHERDETLEDVKFYLTEHGVNLGELRTRRYQYLRKLDEENQKGGLEQQKLREKERNERKKANIDRFKQKMSVAVFDDDHGAFIERKWNDQIEHIVKTHGDPRFTIKTTPEEILAPLFDNLGDLPDSRNHRKEFDQAVFEKYDDRRYAICFPLGQINSHWFRVQLAYKV